VDAAAVGAATVAALGVYVAAQRSLRAPELDWLRGKGRP
jgi:hypothetical protein